MKSPSSDAFDRPHLVSPLERVSVNDGNSSHGCLVNWMTVMEVGLCSSNAFVSSSIVMPFLHRVGGWMYDVYMDLYENHVIFTIVEPDYCGIQGCTREQGA